MKIFTRGKSAANIYKIGIRKTLGHIYGSDVKQW